MFNRTGRIPETLTRVVMLLTAVPLMVFVASGSSAAAVSGNFQATASYAAKCSPGVPAQHCQQAANVYSFATTHNFSPPQGLRGKAAYSNSDGLLPAGGDYLEYRLYATPGSTERLVIDRSNPAGNSWFSVDHYETFAQFYLLS